MADDQLGGECLSERRGLSSLHFEVLDVSSDGREIYTDRGIYDHFRLETKNADTAKSTDSKLVQPKHAYYLEDGNRWIMDRKRRRVCRLPMLVGWVNFRAWGDTAVIGDESGRVLILHLTPLDVEKRR